MLKNPYFQLHFSIFIFGFTVILGKLISLNEFWLVWYRLALATLGYSIFMRRKDFRLPVRQLLKLALGGLILTLHWITFFGSIKYANASIGAVCLSVSVVFAAFLEPFFYGKKLQWIQILLALVVVSGIYLIHQFQAVYSIGLVWGLISAFLSALWSIVNKRIVKGMNNTTVNFYELGFGWMILSVLAPAVSLWEGSFTFPSATDWIWLPVLAFICTNYAYNISINSLRYIPTYSYVLAFNMETIYGILLATLIFGENQHVNTGTVIGFMMVLISVFTYPFLNRQWELRQARRAVRSN